jgi:hypothetical protein
VPVGGWESAPGCIHHGLPGTPYPNVYAPYEKCADFFTFGKGSTIGTFSDGVNSSYWILTVIGFSVMVAALVGWVMLEDRKLRTQAAYLLKEGMGARASGPQPGVGGPGATD